jgi:hypothetical protein
MCKVDTLIHVFWKMQKRCPSPCPTTSGESGMVGTATDFRTFLESDQDSCPTTTLSSVSVSQFRRKATMHISKKHITNEQSGSPATITIIVRAGGPQTRSPVQN